MTLASTAEMARALVLLVVTIAYAGFWFALALLCSVVFRSAATAALVALGLWLFLTILWPLFSPPLAGGSAVNVAVTLFPPLIVNAQVGDELEQAPDQPANVEPAAGMADSVTAASFT